MYERLVTKLGSSYIGWMMIVTRLGGLFGGAAVVYYVQLALDLSGSLQHHFTVVAAIVVMCAVTLTVLMALWETRNLRKVLQHLQLGRSFSRELGIKAGREAVVFPVKHHLREAVLVPLVCLPPVYVYLTWSADAPVIVLIHITIAALMGVSVAVSLTYFAIDRAMIPVVRHLTDYGVYIDFDDLPTGRLQNRLIFLFTLIVVVTALMIAVLANQKVAALVDFPGSLDEVVTSLRVQTVVISTCAVLMAVFLSTLLARSVTTRVRDMVHAMRRVEIGQLDTRITAISTDEIGMLGRSFNKMLAQLEQSSNTIREFNSNLERKVQERTQQLAETNEKLQESFEKLKENDRLKTAFFSNVSHEFRTPLTLILAPVENLLETSLGSLTDEQRHALDIVRRNTVRLLNLINDLLDFAKLDAGQARLTAGPANINEVIDEIVSSASLLAVERDINLEFHPDEMLPVVMVDLDKFERIIINLVSNALKFTGRDGTVTVESHLVKDNIVISIADSGIGIDSADHEKVFKRFVQIDGTMTRRYEGTGLGLPMVKEFVELHGGTITIESELGKGSIFELTLPIRPAPASAATRLNEPRNHTRQVNYSMLLKPDPKVHKPPVTHATDDAATILIVDDSPDILSVLRTVLSPDYHVIEATDGVQGLTLAREHEPDIIVSDVMMPRMDGHELCCLIKDNPQTERIGFIMLTAKVDLAMKIEGLDQGADDYLVKPFNPDELRARVRSLLKVRRLDRQLHRRNEELEKTLDELTRTKDHLVHSEKLSSLGQLAAGVAHEINNAINAVYNGILPLGEQVREIEGIVLSKAGRAAQKEAIPDGNDGQQLKESFSLIGDLVEVIESGAKRTTDIVTDLKKFAHPGTGDRRMSDVHESIGIALNLLANKLKGSVTVHRDYCDDACVRCSASQLSQVFLNLLENARHAIGEKGDIFISTRRDENELRIHIRDTGPGIPQEALRQIFDPFYTTKEVGVGTGLGLSISYSIVKGHGGSIDVESHTQGEQTGTEFTIHLPLEFTLQDEANHEDPENLTGDELPSTKGLFVNT